MIGFSPQIFGLATEFLDEVDALEPGCGLLDISMSGTSGPELLDELKEKAPGLSGRHAVRPRRGWCGGPLIAVGCGSLLE